MILRDPIHGTYDLPRHLGYLLATPEVMRLSQIRLVNTPSVSQATLGDLRRLSHTLGVLSLAKLLPRAEYDVEEWRCFEAAILLHDIGTPPFAHLLEYHLRESQMPGWSHEGVIRNVLEATHVPENTAHQMFAGRTIGVIRAMEKAGLDSRLVYDMVTGRHPLARLLFGTLDLDNIDNIVRMAWALGVRGWQSLATKLVPMLHVDRNHNLVAAENQTKPLVREWCQLRRAVYEVLTFDPIAIAFQALLSEAIGIGLQDGVIGIDDWAMTDEGLLERLRSHHPTKRLIQEEYYDVPPALAFCIQIAGSAHAHKPASRAELKPLAEAALRTEFPNRQSLGYAILDRGMFERRISFKEPDAGTWTEGNQSETSVVYGFLRDVDRVPRLRARRAAEAFLSAASIASEHVLRLQCGSREEVDDAQGKFDFAIA